MEPLLDCVPNDDDSAAARTARAISRATTRTRVGRRAVSRTAASPVATTSSTAALSHTAVAATAACTGYRAARKTIGRTGPTVSSGVRRSVLSHGRRTTTATARAAAASSTIETTRHRPTSSLSYVTTATAVGSISPDAASSHTCTTAR